MPNPTLAPTPTVSGILDRLKAGGDVAPDELARAEAAERLDALRAEAADRAAAERAEAERLERIAAFRASLPSRFDPAPIEKAEAKLARAVGEYLDACKTIDDEMGAATEELHGLGTLPDGLAVDSPRFGMITDGGRLYRRSRPQTTIAGVVTTAIKARWPRQLIELDRPQD